MAVHTTVSGFTNALAKYPAKVQKGTSDGVSAAAFAVKVATLSEFTKASGGDLRLSGVGRKGGKVGVNYQIHKGTNPTATIKATGPAHFIEGPTKPHWVGGRRGRGRSKGLLVINGQVVTGPVFVKRGAPAQHAWTKGMTAGMTAARPAMRAAFHRALIA